MAMRQLTKDTSSAPVIFGGQKVRSRARGSEGLIDVPLVFSERLRNLERAAVCPRSHTAPPGYVSFLSFIIVYLFITETFKYLQIREE